jgi:hypothetical protein
MRTVADAERAVQVLINDDVQVGHG